MKVPISSKWVYLLCGTLVACSKPPAPSPSICSPVLPKFQVERFVSASTAENAKNLDPEDSRSAAFAYKALAFDCVKQLSRQFAPSRDGARDVATAAIAACKVEVGFATSTAFFAYVKLQSGDGFKSAEAYDAKIERELGDAALLDVVEARAGSCSPVANSLRFPRD